VIVMSQNLHQEQIEIPGIIKRRNRTPMAHI
jgi:hypothetical protein